MSIRFSRDTNPEVPWDQEESRHSDDSAKGRELDLIVEPGKYPQPSPEADEPDFPQPAEKGQVNEEDIGGNDEIAPYELRQGEQ